MNTKDYNLILNDISGTEISVSAQYDRISISIDEYDTSSFDIKLDSAVKLRDYLNDYIEEHDNKVKTGK